MLKYSSIKKIMFNFQPETAHSIAECGLKTISSISYLKNLIEKKLFTKDPLLKQDLFGVTFENPIGLGAGFDKNASMLDATKMLGFGFTELGTVTPRPQPGNPKPRMFRYPKVNSIQNAMGFNNIGSIKFMENLEKALPFSYPVGINIGKNKTTPEEYAIEDYRLLLKRFDSYADYFVINISSPNTPNLRNLQNKTFIKELFNNIKEITSKPVLLKIAPDMDEKTAVALSKCAVENGADGIIATNTTIDYSLIHGCRNFGGLSGEVLNNKSLKIFKAVAKELFGKTILISVGGISNAEQAYERIKAGASLIQIFSGFIFQGPCINKKINSELIQLLKKDGYCNIKDAIGSDYKSKENKSEEN